MRTVCQSKTANRPPPSVGEEDLPRVEVAVHEHQRAAAGLRGKLLEARQQPLGQDSEALRELIAEYLPRPRQRSSKRTVHLLREGIGSGGSRVRQPS